jgi:hypothetical protein
MNSQQQRSALPASDAAPIQQYRSLSGLAVLSFLLGLLSVVALAHPGAWLFPAAATVCGALAMRRITQCSDALMGRPLAVSGLLLGLFFLSWAPTTYFADRWLISRQARHFSEQWLSAVFDGQLGRAYQATLTVRRRQPLGTDLDEYYEANPSERAERDAYFQELLPRQLADLKGVGQYRFDRSLEISFDRDYTLAVLRYFIDDRSADKPVVHLQLEMIRETDRDGVYWTLIKLADADEVDREIRSRGR